MTGRIILLHNWGETNAANREIIINNTESEASYETISYSKLLSRNKSPGSQLYIHIDNTLHNNTILYLKPCTTNLEK